MTTRTHAAALAALLLALPALAQTPAPTAPAAPAPAAAAPFAAASGPKAPNPNNGHGMITAVSATSVTVTPKAGAAKTFALTPATKVMLDGQPATAAAMTVGLRANVVSRDGVTARAVRLHTKKAKAAVAGLKGRMNPFKPAATL